MGAPCGDFVCGPTESCASCPTDCGGCAGCGDLVCGAGETCSTCPGDCGACPPRCGDFVCGATESCSSCPGDCGACPPACSAATCGGGCCQGGTCRSGDDDFACGTAGLACVDCGERGICVDGACYVDPESLWTIVIDSLALTPADYSGASWDVGSGPDPLIWVRVGSATTPPAEIDGPDNTLAITYSTANRVMSRRASDIYALLRFEIWEDDSPGDDRVCFFDYVEQVGEDGAAFTFLSGTWTARCVASASTMDSEMTLTWHIEPG
ncbi:MAG: hypothetical protein J0L92_30040 [Deltaproteobacteria bacterium]|nr:hypothetical protein [Deltaproteobacteria bacterium]